MKLEFGLDADWRWRKDQWTRMAAGRGWLKVHHFHIGPVVLQVVKPL
jgi:hypothetical protein